jgi:hypothetical protein
MVVALVAIAGFLVYGFVKKQNPPVVAERTELSKYDTPKNEDAEPEKEISDKKSAEQPKKAAVNGKKIVPMVKITVNSNIPGVRVFNNENGKTICKAPCSKKFPKKNDGVIILGFEYEDYSIKPMAVTLDKDMIVNLNLKQETENE